VEFDNGQYKGAVVSRIVPAPYTLPEPRTMSVAARPSSVERAARKAQPAFILAFDPPRIDTGDAIGYVTKNFTAYREALESQGHSQEKIDAALEWTTHSYQHVVVADTDEQAQQDLDLMLEEYQRTVEREYIANKAAEAILGIDLRAAPDARTQGYKDTWCLAGSPDTVIGHLQEFKDLGIGNVLGAFMGGPLTPERRRVTDKTMNLFSEKVIPALR
jgi:alkanesulfonate monooxygenase SsuD/methylene tetrahydromethanopterin reductase-like flavin-dependent oxidoreductase (luciferase family)